MCKSCEKECLGCGHQRLKHPYGEKCKFKGCNCDCFQERLRTFRVKAGNMTIYQLEAEDENDALLKTTNKLTVEELKQSSPNKEMKNMEKI